MYTGMSINKYTDMHVDKLTVNILCSDFCHVFISLCVFVIQSLIAQSSLVIESVSANSR